MKSDIIGGFPIIEPNCMGCGKPLLVENAWMTDGCPCNSVLGVNNRNETRWRLLMELQQSQANSMAELLREGLVVLAGAVCTPEAGYKNDGGPSQFLSDIKQLRRQRDNLLQQVPLQS